METPRHTAFLQIKEHCPTVLTDFLALPLGELSPQVTERASLHFYKAYRVLHSEGLAFQNVLIPTGFPPLVTAKMEEASSTAPISSVNTAYVSEALAGSP